MRGILLFTFLTWAIILPAQIISDFEGILQPGDSVLDGSAGTTFALSGNAEFPITWNPDFGGFWAGNWAISSVADDTTSGFANLYGAITGGGHRGSATFAVGQQGAVIRLLDDAQGKTVRGLYLTNSTYAHNSMRDGDEFAKPFGGPDGTDPDFFRLIIRAYRNGALGADSLVFYLADYRFEVDSLDYLIDDWQFVDLRPLGPVDSLEFRLESSDVGEFGINTPLFFCVDDLITTEPAPRPAYVIDFEMPFLGLGGADDGRDGSGGFDQGQAFFPNTYNPDFGGFWSSGWALSGRTDSVTSGFTNLLSAITGRGFGNSLQYAVGQQNAVVQLQGPARGATVQGLYVTNTTYAHNSMRDGDDFAKPFGGPDGTDPDFFRLTVRKFLNGQLGKDSVEVYLADYRFENDSLDFILDDWAFLDLQSLGPADSLLFTLASSDVGEFGINTPLFFALDNLILFDVANQAGVPADSAAIVAWASGIEVERGPSNVANPSSGLASAGAPSNAVGPYDGAVVSLGDGGQATLTFDRLITDGEGPDFAVYENGFPTGDAYFLELAVVEVSSDGEHFVRFPASSRTDTAVQVGPFGLLRPEDLRNLAGRFPGRLGTPFDLAELRGAPGLDVDAITHVRVIDAVGSIDPAFATLDAEGRPINDPFPTDFASGGFDLSGVGIMNGGTPTSTVNVRVDALAVWPNPTNGPLRLELPGDWGSGHLRIIDMQGRTLRLEPLAHRGTVELDLSGLAAGWYLLELGDGQHRYVTRILRR